MTCPLSGWELAGVPRAAFEDALAVWDTLLAEAGADGVPVIRQRSAPSARRASRRGPVHDLEALPVREVHQALAALTAARLETVLADRRAPAR